MMSVSGATSEAAGSPSASLSGRSSFKLSLTRPHTADTAVSEVIGSPVDEFRQVLGPYDRHPVILNFINLGHRWVNICSLFGSDSWSECQFG
jgi:hypothetical protein